MVDLRSRKHAASPGYVGSTRVSDIAGLLILIAGAMRVAISVSGCALMHGSGAGGGGGGWYTGVNSAWITVVSSSHGLGTGLPAHGGALSGIRPTCNGDAFGSRMQASAGLVAAPVFLIHGWMKPERWPMIANASLARTSKRCGPLRHDCGGSMPSMHTPSVGLPGLSRQIAPLLQLACGSVRSCSAVLVQVCTQRLPVSTALRSGSAWQLHVVDAGSADGLIAAENLAIAEHWASLVQPSTGVIASSCLRSSSCTCPARIPPTVKRRSVVRYCWQASASRGASLLSMQAPMPTLLLGWT